MAKTLSNHNGRCVSAAHKKVMWISCWDYAKIRMAKNKASGTTFAVRSFDKMPRDDQIAFCSDYVRDRLDCYPLTGCRIELNQHYVNTTFRLHCNEGEFLVRVHRQPKWCNDMIESEMRLIQALDDESELDVQSPCLTKDNALVLKDGVFPLTILKWLNGKTVRSDSRNVQHYEAIGRIIGQLHEFVKKWKRCRFNRLPIDVQLYDSEFRSWYSEEESESDDALKLRESVQKILDEVKHLLGQGPENFGIVHGDLSFGNVIFAKNQVFPVDFDDCGFGYYIYDLAIVLAGAYGHSEFESKQDALISAYRSVTQVEDKQVSLLPVFVLLRAAMMCQWRRVSQLLNEIAKDLRILSLLPQLMKEA